MRSEWHTSNKHRTSTLTLHEFGGTRSCVISPACTQKRCNNVPLYKSHKHTAKSTPPDSKCDLSYLSIGWKYLVVVTNLELVWNGTLNGPKMDIASSSHDHDVLIRFDVLANLYEMYKSRYWSFLIHLMNRIHFTCIILLANMQQL